MPCRTMLCRMRRPAARSGLRGRACAALGSRARTPLQLALLDNVLQRVAALVAFAGQPESLKHRRATAAEGRRIQPHGHGHAASDPAATGAGASFCLHGWAP